ncbi:MAG: hypothetical protein Kow0025_23040 [Thermodesulfovibrionales bacterium]
MCLSRALTKIFKSESAYDKNKYISGRKKKYRFIYVSLPDLKDQKDGHTYK